jgi:hypothetical protein
MGVVSTGLLTSYLLFATSAKRPLSLSESLFFSSTLLRALPSSGSTGGNWLSAIGLVREAIAFPESKSNYSSVVTGQRYEVALPPHTVRHPGRTLRGAEDNPESIRHCPERDCLYITFATPEQLETYYTITLPKGGWKYADRMGAARLFSKNSIQLLIVDRPNYYRGTKISELAVSIYKLNHQSRI